MISPHSHLATLADSEDRGSADKKQGLVLERPSVCQVLLPVLVPVWLFVVGLQATYAGMLPLLRV